MLKSSPNGSVAFKVDYSRNQRYGGERRFRNYRSSEDFDRQRNSQYYYSSRKRQRTMSGSETGSEGAERGGGRRGGDLASKTIMLESKRFYLDVKENNRGRFIKIAEISADGRKNQIMMSLATAAQFRQHLSSMIEFYSDLGPIDPEHICQGELKSEVMFKEDKKYHIDLKENARGRFLKVSETFTRGYSRFQIFIPADGMEEFNNQLRELIEEFDDGEADDGAVAPDVRHLRIENKNFYFACKKNAQGRYMTISEVKGNFRNSILIPETGWEEFRDVLDDFTNQCKTSD